MANPHPFDVLIQAHRDGRYEEERGLAIYDDVDFFSLHPVHQVPFISLLSAEVGAMETGVFHPEDEHCSWWKALGAAMGNQTEDLELILQTYAPDEYAEELYRHYAMLGAAKSGNLSLIESLRARGATLDSAAEGAAWGGHLELMNQLIEQGASPSAAIMGAARGNQVQLFEILNVQESDYIEIIKGAASAGQEALLQEYLQKESECFDRWYHQMLKASRSQNWAQVAKLVCGDVVIDRIHPVHGVPVITLLAAEPNNEDAIFHLIEAGAQLRWAVLGAAMGRQHSLTTKLLRRGASLDHAVEGAARCGDTQRVDELLATGANRTRAIRGAASQNQEMLLSHLFDEPTLENIHALIKGAALGNQSTLMWHWLNSWDTPDSSQLKEAFDIALEAAGRGGHQDLAKSLLNSLRDRPLQNLTAESGIFNVIVGAAHGGHFAWVESLLLNWRKPLSPEDRHDWNAIDKLLRSAARNGSLAMVHRFLPMHCLASWGEDYSGAIVGGAESGKVLFIDKFIQKQEVLEDRTGANSRVGQDKAVNYSLELASWNQDSLSVERLLMAGANYEFAVGNDYFKSTFEAATFLAGIKDVYYRRAYVEGVLKQELIDAQNRRELPIVPAESTKLAIGLKLSNFMSKYDLTAREAHALFYHRAILLVMLQLQQNNVGALPPIIWRLIACLVTAENDYCLTTGEMENIHSAITTLYANARLMCGPETNFNGNALYFWLEQYANFLKGRIWPAQQAKGAAIEALLHQINAQLTSETLDAELMLNCLQMKNNDGESIRSLMEPTPHWQALLSRFPAIAEQLQIQPTLKKASSSLG